MTTTEGDHSPPLLPSFGARRNLREEIIETLRGAVISGQLRPGVVYSAPSLAEQFGVSSTPVREAMLDLAREGLVGVVRNKGFRVTDLSDADLDDITHLRALIEIPTVRRIAEAGVDPAAIERLRPLATAIEDAARRQDLIAHVTIDMEFHLTLLGLTGNTYLVETVRSLRSRSRIYGLKILAERDQLIPSSHEHSELLDLISAGDADGAEQLMRRHIGHVRGIWAEKAATDDEHSDPENENSHPENSHP
ncbi:MULTISPECIES: GntR family transcriptional regulator [unclassified Streptomyces]|uniref:GntR family transcriptional regulator n=1 Tax=unclassified Streptomyces TaxID=2593676 RepID=UPI003437AF2F